MARQYGKTRALGESRLLPPCEQETCQSDVQEHVKNALAPDTPNVQAQTTTVIYLATRPTVSIPALRTPCQHLHQHLPLPVLQATLTSVPSLHHV